MSPDPHRIELYDATLRDGMGGGGMSLTAHEKLTVVHALDALGVHMIEAGFPASNPKEQELFSLLASESLQRAEIVAFGMTRRRGIEASQDEGLRVLAESFAPICTLVGKASVLHVEKVVKASREENLAMIADSVAFLVGAGKRVLLDAEHFFDGFVLDPGYSLDCLRAASQAGAERAVLCDTNGGSLPPQIRTAMAVVSEALPDVPIGIHTHNDSGCAVANTLMAVECGATQVQGTINGIGERTGNANLITIIADLQLKMGVALLAPEQLARLTYTAHRVDELLNRAPNPWQPYVGKNAFAHKAGLHAAGVRTESATFEHIDPGVVGNHSDVLVSELAGKAAVQEKADRVGIPLDDDAARSVLEAVKRLEHEGFEYESAEASLELLMLKATGGYEPLFRLESWRVIVEESAASAASDALGGRPGARHVDAEATLKLWRDGERYVRSAEGAGPVDALDRALREAIREFYPELDEMELVDFRVRLLETAHGTGASTRVHIESAAGDREWATTGGGPNIIAASWWALLDAFDYYLQPGLRDRQRQVAETSQQE